MGLTETIWHRFRGSMNITLQQSRDFNMYSEEAWTKWYTKGELIQRLSAGTLGKRLSWSALCP